MAEFEKLADMQIAGRVEGLQLLEVQSQHYLGISAAEFVRRWDAGEYRGGADRSEVMRVASLLAFAR